MTPAIAGWWWVFLIAAVIVTLVDVYLLLRVVRLARGISVLTRRTLPAADGIAEKTSVGGPLGTTQELLGVLRGRGAALGGLVGTLAEQITRKDS